MPVICLPNCAFLSETSRMIAVYLKLKEIGTPVIMATHGGTYESAIKQEGIPYQQIEPFMTEEECSRYVDACIKVKDLSEKNSLLKNVQSEMAFFKEQNAQAVITGFTLTTVLSARGAGIPLAVTHLGSCVPPIVEKNLFACSEYFDNFFTSLIPDEWINRFANWLYNHLPSQLKNHNWVAAALDIEPVRSFDDLLMGDLTLVTDVPEILTISEEEMEAWRPTNTKYHRPSARLKYAGAIYAKLFGNIPNQVSDFLDTDKPKVYVAMSSGSREDLQLVYSTLANMKVRAVVCATAHHGTFGQAGNILVWDFLPSHLVMPLCDLAIIHGGQGSVQTAIASGIPIIGFPLQPEQNFNLKLMERHGAGLCLSQRSLRKGRLKPAIDQVLSQGSYRKCMERLQKWQASRDGPLEAARAVTALIAD